MLVTYSPRGSNRTSETIVCCDVTPQGPRVSTASDWVFLAALLLIVLAVALVMALAIGYLAFRMLSILFGWS